MFNPPPYKPLEKINTMPKIRIKFSTAKRKQLKADKEFYQLYLEWRWEQGLPNCCDECGEQIIDVRTFNLHHLLPKRNYPALRHNFQNLTMLCWGCHDRFERGLVTEWMRNRTEQARHLLIPNNEP